MTKIMSWCQTIIKLLNEYRQNRKNSFNARNNKLVNNQFEQQTKWELMQFLEQTKREQCAKIVDEMGVDETGVDEMGINRIYV